MLTTRLAVAKQQVSSEIYLDADARKILQFMLRSPRTPIVPETLATDEIQYPELRSLVEPSGEKLVELLGRMVEAKALVADLVDKVPACPECGSLPVEHSIPVPEMLQLRHRTELSI